LLIASRMNASSILPSGDGAKSVYMRLKDTVGNWSSAYSDAIILDTAPPDTTITAAPENPTGNTSATAHSKALTGSIEVLNLQSCSVRIEAKVMAFKLSRG